MSGNGEKALEDCAPEDARAVWDQQSRALGKQVLGRLQALIANGLSYEMQKAIYDEANAAFIMIALGLESVDQIPKGMTVELALENITPERYGAAARRQAEIAANHNPLHLMVIFSTLMDLDEDIFLVLENFAAEKYRKKQEAAEIGKVLETLFPMHQTPQ